MIEAIDGSYKSTTIESYDNVAPDYAVRDEQADVPEKVEVWQALKYFAHKVKSGSILDVGSGGGRDSRFFYERGFAVTGIDNSKRMLEQAGIKNPGIDYRYMDLEELDFPDETFSGVWCNASLHHIPKAHLPAVLRSISQVMKPNAHLFVKVKQGEGEGMRSNEKFGRTVTRYFAYYRGWELRVLLERAGFTMLSLNYTTQDEWVDVLARKT